MDADYIITTYVVLDDSLKALHFQDDVRATVSTAEILTVALVAARYFHNHLERALCLLQQQHYLHRLSISRFNRRLHQALGWLRRLMGAIRQRYLPIRRLYIVDALPLPVCQRIRQRRCRKVRGQRFIGWCDAKRVWFFGYKLHWCCDEAGVPVCFTLRPASRHEGKAVTGLLRHLPAGATVVGDGAYVSRKRALAWLKRGIRLVAKRYGRMSPNPPDEQDLLRHRQRIEVVHSQLESMGVQRLRARTRAGFCLKVICSLLALMMTHLVSH
jgi:hypothetical protein